MSTRTWASRILPALATLSALALAGCGGGGGGGGGDGSIGGGTTTPTSAAAFTGFSFRIGPAGSGTEFTTPPMEDLSAAPPQIGGPLDLVVIFNFDPTKALPAGPFTQTTLPVYTTPAEAPAEAVPPNGAQLIPAKGTYVLVDYTVEFRPFLPQDPMSISPSAPPESIPGFLPGAVYTAKVETTPGLKIANLTGAGGLVKFGTTAIPGGFFTGLTDDEPPTLQSSDPGNGEGDFYPGLFSNTPVGSPFPTFIPKGDEVVSLVFDHGVTPSVENLEGQDWNDDGIVDANFFMRCRSSKLIVSHTVPAGTFNVGDPAFAALSGLDESFTAPGSVVDQVNGSGIFLHNSAGGFTGGTGTADLDSAPTCLAAGMDPSLVFAVFAGAGDDSLAVLDHTLGDPSAALVSTASIAVPLTDLTGLITLLDGRMVAFDRVLRKIVELRAEVVRDVPLGAPTLVSVKTPLDAVEPAGFISAAFLPAYDVRDLAQAPSGELFALTTVGNVSYLVGLNVIDVDVDGQFESDDGLPNDTQAIALPGSGPYEAFEFLSRTTGLALQREADRVDFVNLITGDADPVVTTLAGFGPLPPAEDSPALSILVSHMQLDVAVDLVDNQPDRAEFLLDPLAVLPASTDVDVMQRPNLASLSGITEANEPGGAPDYVLGARRLLTVRTADPDNTTDDCGSPDDRIHDVVFEDFADNTLEDPAQTTTNPAAEWNGPIAGGVTSGMLQATVGVDATVELGDFRPLPFPDFDPDLGYSSNEQVVNQANWRFVFLDTDAQTFPLADGSTPGVITPVTVYGGKFGFRDVVIPPGVFVVARGTKPLQITATGKFELGGVIDVTGGDGAEDVTFDTGFLPVPGGTAGAGAGRGGNGHPTLWDPRFPSFVKVGTGQLAAQYVTPETGEDGYGWFVGPSGVPMLGAIGGRGGITTAGYDPTATGYPKINNSGDNTEHSRPPGGGGGSFYFHGMPSHVGTGAYRVQSSSHWSPFTLCPTPKTDTANYFKSDAAYGNEELFLQQHPTHHALQCIYIQGTIANPVRFQPGALPGHELFTDGDPSNDFIGPGGEIPVLIGGQGGGGGGTRPDSFNAGVWAASKAGAPFTAPPLPPTYYPPLQIGNIFWSPTLFDAKGGGGGGGGGSVLIRSFGNIRLTKFGHIDASGGRGRGGETVGNSNYSGGGGGGSGGAIVLEAAGEIFLEADPDHVTPGYTDMSLAHGAALDVSGGFGFDAIEFAEDNFNPPKDEDKFGRSDGGQGGFGLIQLQTGGALGGPQVEQGAFMFARQKAIIKLGGWNGGSAVFDQREHEAWNAPNPAPPAAWNFLRYIDVLEYRNFEYEVDQPFNWFVLNGADPPLIQPDGVVPPGTYQLDTPMLDHFGRRVVREPHPEHIMATYDTTQPAPFKEANWCLTCTPKKYLDTPPGTLYAPTDAIPLSIHLKEPDGTPLKEDPSATSPFAEFAHANTVDRLPVVPLDKTPPPIGTVSRGTSKWLDFNGVALNARDALSGLAPPLFPGINGTYNALHGAVPPGKEGQVVLGGVVANVPGNTPAHFVANSGPIPAFDIGLCPAQGAGSPPTNDIKVDAPDYGIENAITDNAKVTLEFQGAFPIRAGSHVPDPATLTGWISDLRDLSGYPLVRFRVSFDLGINPSFPFGPTSKKPGVDHVRLRVEY